jgi:hypothetical protein
MHYRRHIALVSSKIPISGPIPNTAIFKISGEALASRHLPPLWEACYTHVFFCDPSPFPIPHFHYINYYTTQPLLTWLCLMSRAIRPLQGLTAVQRTFVCSHEKLTDLVFRPKPFSPLSPTTTEKPTTNTTKSGATGKAASPTLFPSSVSSVSAASPVRWMTY